MSGEREVPEAEQELSDEQIVDQYGPLLEKALYALEHEQGYLVEMARNASMMVLRRERWQVWRETRRREQHDAVRPR